MYLRSTSSIHESNCPIQSELIFSVRLSTWGQFDLEYRTRLPQIQTVRAGLTSALCPNIDITAGARPKIPPCPIFVPTFGDGGSSYPRAISTNFER